MPPGLLPMNFSGLLKCRASKDEISLFPSNQPSHNLPLPEAPCLSCLGQILALGLQSTCPHSSLVCHQALALCFFLMHLCTTPTSLATPTHLCDIDPQCLFPPLLCPPPILSIQHSMDRSSQGHQTLSIPPCVKHPVSL